MSREAYSPPDPSGWLTMSIKLILFPIDPQHREKREWWKEITDKEPDESLRRPEATVEAGLVAPDRRFSVTVNPVKMDIEYDPVQAPPNEVASLPLTTLGPLASEAEQFLNRVVPWLQHAPPIKRIGFAANMAFQSATREDNYRLLDRMLETVDVDPASADFQYRVNRKTESRSDPAGTLINRLMVWSSQKLTRSVMTLSGEKMEAHEIGDGVNFAALALDVNTDYSRTARFAPESMEGLCRELAGLTMRIVAQGDKR